MSMLLKAGDYVILNVVLGKSILAKCSAVNKDGTRGKATMESKSDKPEPPVEFKTTEVLANLGSSPNTGSVYGIKVEPIRERLDSPFWGEIKIHHELDDDQRKMLKRTMSDVSTKMKSQNVPKLAIETQIRTQAGKMAGFYKYQPKAESDVLCVKLDPDMSDLEYRFSHEYAHGIWYRCFTPKMKMAWVNMFHDAIKISKYSDKDLHSMLEDIKTNGDVRAFAKENPDDLPVLKAIFRYINQTHSMSRQHFEMALMLGENIDGYWPKSIELGEKNEILSTYAKKCPEELWAESFSLKFIGKKLPSSISALLEKCMRNLVK